jgi:hypothetical protein
VNKDSMVEDLKKALLNYGYSLAVAEKILKWYA